MVLIAGIGLAGLKYESERRGEGKKVKRKGRVMRRKSGGSRRRGEL
jgi:hypothetical protein